MSHRLPAAFILAASVASSAFAQAPPVVTLSPADPARWDIGFNVGWLGANKSEIAPDWNDWYDVASFDASTGYYWTPHLKLELDLGTTTKGSIFTQDVEFSGSAPYVVSRDHTFRTTSLAGAVTYQFFENRWFHPFVSGGLAVVHEREQASVSVLSGRDPRVPPPPVSETTSVSARPFAALGLKAYASRRVFFRTDLRVTASKEHAESVTWRGGIGFDF